jgi:hypothetical protein
MSNYGPIISEDDQALLLSFKLVPTVLTTYVKASLLATKKQTKIKYTAIRFVSISAKFGICIVIGLNGTLVEAKTRT